jgi:hypothetical protein
MGPIVDRKRPIYWYVAGLSSSHYRGLWECRDLPEQERIALRLTHYSPTLNFIFHHNAKAASTTLQRLLSALLRRKEAQMGLEPRGLLSGPAHWREILPKLNSQRVYRFSFVRDPVDRAVSTFNNFFVEQQNEYTKRHCLSRRKFRVTLGDASHENFGRFLDLAEDLLMRDPDRCDLHIRTQHRNLLLDVLKYDFLGRMERYDSDLQGLLQAIGLGDVLEDQDLQIRENRSSSDRRLLLPTEDQRRRIEALYDEDYTSLGYTRNSTVIGVRSLLDE